jgi:hypothetical protein
MAMGYRSQAALASFRAPITARHLCRGTRLIDEDEAGEIKGRLRLAPGLAPRGDVEPILLGCVRRFF